LTLDIEPIESRFRLYCRELKMEKEIKDDWKKSSAISCWSGLGRMPSGRVRSGSSPGRFGQFGQHVIVRRLRDGRRADTPHRSRTSAT